MIDKQGRLFGKVNIIDCAVIVLLIGLVVAAVYRFSSSSMTRESDSRIRYTLDIAPVRDFTLEFYEPGLACYDKLNQEFIGNIEAVRSEPFLNAGEMEDGSLVMSEQEGLIRVFVDIVADAKETETAYLLNGAYELKVGSQLNLNTKYIDVTGKVDSAEVIEQ